MVSLLLAVIYIAFIGLGLPDSLLGAGWPVMRVEFGMNLDFAGVISMIISGGTILSSLLSDRLTRRFGASLVTACSVTLTAGALLGFSVSRSAQELCLWAIPYGLGAGAVDAALNNYVALHFSARHMSWLHCFWGVGASISPYIMSVSLASEAGWRGGYRTVSILQIGISALLFASLPLWKRVGAQTKEASEASAAEKRGSVWKIPGVPQVLLAFFSYCSLEWTAALWAASYFVEYKGIDSQTAARFASLFFLGITFGRFVNGFLAERLGDRRSIRIGSVVMLIGMLLVALPIPGGWNALAGLLIFGFGCAPVYPGIIHSTPANFGRENSQRIVGIQMASAYVGSTFMPSVFGFLARHIGIALYPFYILAFTMLMIAMNELLARRVRPQEERNNA